MATSSHQWLIYAIASGACAAINGVFAKLTTTTLTSTLASSLAHLFGLNHSTFFELLVRGSCFGLNLLFDGIMWGLFTRALTLASSTVHVSVLNTSTNFLVAATAGYLVFGERLPGLWWVGAALLVAGCLLIGRREGGDEAITGGHGDDGGRIRQGQSQELDRVLAEEVDDPLPGVRTRSPYRDESEDEGGGKETRARGS
ncbi:hypothetical protein MBLNU457_1363t1 [Dothideomycetes sp. NU457]